MKRILCILAVLALLVPCATALGGEDTASDDQKAEKEKAPTKQDKKRAKIDTMEKQVMERLLSGTPKAKELMEQAYGHAVFDGTKVGFIVSGGGGRGVAVEKKSGDRTYMKMGTGGAGFSFGGQAFQIIYIFQNKRTYDHLLENGWDATTAANAVAGGAGANVEAKFVNGMCVFVLTKGGLMLNADIAGTHYWQDKNLN
jgi:lipid-binding SYLF domain-containing protein